MTASSDRPAAQPSVSAGAEPVSTRTGLRGLTFRRLYTDGATQLPFTRWAEFCDTSDPDCA